MSPPAAGMTISQVQVFVATGARTWARRRSLTGALVGLLFPRSSKVQQALAIMDSSSTAAHCR